MPEWLSYGLGFAAVGVLIVFAALTIIALSVTLFRKIDNRWQEREAQDRKDALDREPSIDSLTLVLITAAVATMIQGRFHIRKVRRLLPRSSKAGPWRSEGRAVLLGSHVVPKKK